MYRPDWWPSSISSYDGVLDIAETLHCHITGSLKMMDDARFHMYVSSLKWVEANWHSASECAFDLAVRGVIRAALAEVAAKTKDAKP